MLSFPTIGMCVCVDLALVLEGLDGFELVFLLGSPTTNKPLKALVRRTTEMSSHMLGV